jgi:hypothetical protein
MHKSLIKSESKLLYFPRAPFVTGRGKKAKLEDRVLDGPGGSESRNGAPCDLILGKLERESTLQKYLSIYCIS